MDNPFRSNGESQERQRVPGNSGSEKIGSDAVRKTVKGPAIPFGELAGRTAHYYDDDSGLEPQWVRTQGFGIVHANHLGRS